MHVDGFAHRWRPVLLLIIFLLVTCAMLAEEGVLALVVTDTREHPFANVQIGTEGEGGSPQFTDQNGKARLRLAPNTKPAAWVTLQLGSTPNDLDLDFISPFNRRVRVPPFDNGPDNYDEVTLAKHADKETLETGSGMLAIHSSVNHSVAAAKKKPAPQPPHTSGKRLDYGTPRLLMVGLRTMNSAAPVDRPPANEELQKAALAAAAQKFGFSVAQIKAAIASWGGDPLVWKLMLLNATIEDGGSDPFPAIHTTSNDMHFGAGNWSLSECSLQPLLLNLQKRDKKRFAEIFGADTKWLTTTISGPCAASSQAVLKHVVDGSGHLQPTWRARFRKLGYEHSFQRVQVDEMTSHMTAAQNVANALGLQSEQALAFCYDMVQAHGTNTIIGQRQNSLLDAAAFQQQIGRQPDQQEKLLMLANRVLQPDNQSGGNPLSTDSTESIARASLLSQGQAVIFGTPYQIEDFGIGTQDMQTGADLPLHNDPRVLQQLQDGWIPTEGPPPPPVDPVGEKQLVELINHERITHRLQPLAVDPRLRQAARKHTELLVAHKTVSHQLEGEPPLDVRLATENLSADHIGENTAVDHNVPSLHKGLMDDPDHRDNVLSPDYNAIGVSVIRSGGQLYVTEDFAHLTN